MKFRILFNNGFECVYDNVIKHDQNDKRVKLKLSTGCVKKFAMSEIKEIELL